MDERGPSVHAHLEVLEAHPGHERQVARNQRKHAVGVTNAHGAFENWIEFAKDNYMGINGRNELEWTTFFYDPIQDFKLNFPGAGGSAALAFYLLPQSPEIATLIYEAAANASGWHNPRQAVQPHVHGLLLAKALGDHTAIARLSAARLCCPTHLAHPGIGTPHLPAPPAQPRTDHSSITGPFLASPAGRAFGCPIHSIGC